MFRFTVKAGMASAAVYYVAEQGVWRDSDTTTKLYNSMKKEACPYVKCGMSQLPFEVPSLPKTDNVMQTGAYYWNSGVKSTFNFILNSPTYIKDSSKSVYNNIESLLNSSDATDEK